MSGIFWNPEVSARSRAPELSSQAVVLDVILNEEHPDYGQTGFNVGTIRFKYMDFGAHRDSMEMGFYAYPLEVTVQEYPLIGEIVLIQKIRGNHFYSRRMNVNKKLQLNAKNCKKNYGNYRGKIEHGCVAVTLDLVFMKTHCRLD